jgi:hypothetical protein
MGQNSSIWPRQTSFGKRRKEKSSFRRRKIQLGSACSAAGLPKQKKADSYPEPAFFAERKGFEPSIPCGIYAFQAYLFNHSSTSLDVLVF